MAKPEQPHPERLRIDKWLWFARIVKTRTLAQTLVKTGKIRVNSSRVSTPSSNVSPGDVLTITLPRAVRILRISALGSKRGPASEAQLLYEDLTPPPEPREASPAKPLKQAIRDEGSGRPTKKERREMDRFRSRGDD